MSKPKWAPLGLNSFIRQWKYLYRTFDKEGNTVDYLLTAKRDRKAAKRFICKAIGSNALPIKINIDKNGAKTFGIND